MRESGRDLPTTPRPAPTPIARGFFRRIRWWMPVGAILLAIAGLWAGRQVVLFQSTVAESERVLTKMERRLSKVSPLTDEEVTALRRSLNEAHLAAAGARGMAPVKRRDRLVRIARDSGLVQIESTPRYRVMDMTNSIPVANHGVRRTLDSISVHFWEKLAEQRLPGFRYAISSILRSTEDQANLRGVNVNAAGESSSHEYGTTFDITYRRFDYRGGPEPDLMQIPAALAPGVKGRTRNYILKRRSIAYRRMARDHTDALAALLGRALIELEDEGTLLVLRERRQPVYHVTALLSDTR